MAPYNVKESMRGKRNVGSLENNDIDPEERSRIKKGKTTMGGERSQHLIGKERRK